MCFTAQPGHEQGDRGLLSCCLLHVKWHFASRPSFLCNIPAFYIHYCHPTSPNLHPVPLLRSSGYQSSFCTYCLPLPDQAARLSSDIFSFPEYRLCKTNILEQILRSQPNVQMSYTNQNPENFVLPFFHRCISIHNVACVKNKVQSITFILFLYQ